MFFKTQEKKDQMQFGLALTKLRVNSVDPTIKQKHIEKLRAVSEGRDNMAMEVQSQVAFAK